MHFLLPFTTTALHLSLALLLSAPQDMLLDMRQSLEHCSETLDRIQDPNARDREAVIINAQAQVKKILQEPGILNKVKADELIVVAAFYEITSGIVDFVEVPTA
jgi:carbonic anhydrase